MNHAHATPGQGAVLTTVVVGGVAGAEARYGVGLALHPAGMWATLLINTTGCLLIGVLMAMISERTHPLVRPLLGVGVLGGYTTFSTYAVDTVTAVWAGEYGQAVAYLVATPVLAMLAVTVGVLLTRRLRA